MKNKMYAKTTSYPTGGVCVRFKEPFEDTQLANFADQHRLRVQKRNRYVPAQVSFELIEPTKASLQNLIEELSADPLVKLAWPEMKSQYHRC